MKAISYFLTLSLLTLKLSASPFSEMGNEPWGVDTSLAKGVPTKKISPPKLTTGQKSCRAMIRFFQVYISPIDGPRSSFYPTSSQYALEAIQKYGVFKGIALGCDRLMRENGELWVYERADKFGRERKLDPVR